MKSIFLLHRRLSAGNRLMQRRMQQLSVRNLNTVNVLVVGKKGHVESWIAAGAGEFQKRLAPVMSVNTVFMKSDEALVEAVSDAKGVVLALDETGRVHTSREFSERVFSALQEGGSRLSFVIGGFDGLPPKVKEKAQLLSLGKMTWTHQMARLLLYEQLYRAAEIRKGTLYHKE